ncbi:MAG: isopenicillin N synthase family oxygenase [Alphaproteobacteria bacterium]|nr:isopenicillin N synthase family oxygenase [Alphaproteobacteria bacterium]
MIPTVDISPLLGPRSPGREETDRRLMEAAGRVGFLIISGLPSEVPQGAAVRARLHRVFSLPETAKRALWRRKFDAARPNVYHGWFPLQNGAMTYKEGIDMGPDVADPVLTLDPTDPLTEPTPLPGEGDLPGWHERVAGYYRGMEGLGRLLMRSVARGLGLAETFFDASFAGGNSTLRLIRYPVRPPESFVGGDMAAILIEHRGRSRHLIGGAHIDSGFVTLLAQDGIEGLQARAAGGDWIDVPPTEGTLAVNFGGVLERWTGGRIKATEHRVVGPGRERFSIPFFYEPRVDAVIAPLPIPGIAPFEPFLYGDHLWAAMMRFVEFRGLEAMRQPRGVGKLVGITQGY